MKRKPLNKRRMKKLILKHTSLDVKQFNKLSSGKLSKLHNTMSGRKPYTILPPFNFFISKSPSGHIYFQCTYNSANLTNLTFCLKDYNIIPNDYNDHYIT